MPSINFNRSSENDLVWNSSTNSYTSPKPEHLYGWTDSNVTGTQLYAWTSNYYYSDSSLTIPLTYYTTSPNPSSNDTIYFSDGTVVNSISAYDNVDHYTMSRNTVTSYSNNTITIGKGGA